MYLSLGLNLVVGFSGKFQISRLMRRDDCKLRNKDIVIINITNGLF